MTFTWSKKNPRFVVDLRFRFFFYLFIAIKTDTYAR